MTLCFFGPFPSSFIRLKGSPLGSFFFHYVTVAIIFSFVTTASAYQFFPTFTLSASISLPEFPIVKFANFSNISSLVRDPFDDPFPFFLSYSQGLVPPFSRSTCTLLPTCRALISGPNFIVFTSHPLVLLWLFYRWYHHAPHHSAALAHL